jgi:hypothetical protein
MSLPTLGGGSSVGIDTLRVSAGDWQGALGAVAVASMVIGRMVATVGAGASITLGGGVSAMAVAVWNISASCWRACRRRSPRSLNGVAGVGWCNACIKSLAAVMAMSRVDVAGILLCVGKK